MASLKRLSIVSILEFISVDVINTIKISIDTSYSYYNTIWFFFVLILYAIQLLHVIWTFIYKVNIIKEVKSIYQVPILRKKII